LNKFKKLIPAIFKIICAAAGVAFIGLLIYVAVQCSIKNSEININANAAAYIQKIYPGSEIIDMDCEYEEEDSDYECKATIKTNTGIVMGVEVDCKCSCGEWKGCSLDSD
jgi:hypothetical protein